MAISWVLPVRAVQALFAIITLGLSGYLVSKIGSLVNFSEADFNVFTSVWTMLVCAFFIGTTFIAADSFLTNPLVVLVIDGLSWIFWLAAFGCIASKLGPFEDLPSGFYNSQLETFLGVMKALVAFGVFEWLLFSATLIYNALTAFRGKKSSGGAAPAQGV